MMKKLEIGKKAASINLLYFRLIDGPFQPMIRGRGREMHAALIYPLLLSMVTVGQLLLLQGVGVEGASTTTAARSRSSNESCVRSCGSTSVPYPFGFSSGCTIPLNCSSSSGGSERTMWIGEQELGLEVRNITPHTLILGLPPSCNRSLNAAADALFTSNHAVTSTNALLLQACTPAHNPLGAAPAPAPAPTSSNTCTIPDALLPNLTCTANNSIHCLPPPTSYYHHDFLEATTILASGCRTLLSSVSYAKGDGESLALGALLLGTLELEWWVEGSCDCSQRANCTSLVSPITEQRVFRCSCPEGFQGDGFAAGAACRKVAASKCNPSKYILGACGKTAQISLLMIGISFGAAMMAGICVVCYLVRRRSASLRKRRNTKRLLSEASCTVPLYSYREIERATNGFSAGQRLGTGAYGTVYAGRLSNNCLVAIKKIKQRDNDGIEQVMNEVKLVSSVSHPNLVRLLGCCIEQGQQILVYEFMPNGTLAQHLQRERGPAIPWTVRLRIAAETAKAIAYLHFAVHPPIYHRDIKSSNILLDFDYNTKVADFGLSRMGMMSDSSHISTAPQGTPGYLDPQYHQNFHLSDKSDVYSFGVVLIEIITALKAVDFSRVQNEVNLAQLAIDKIGKGDVDDIVDPCLEPHRDAWTLTTIHKVAELAFRCLAFHSEMRPSMTEVADELEQIQLSGWAPSTDDSMFMSTTSSLCSLTPSHCTDKSCAASKNRRQPILVNAVAEEAQKVAVDSPVSVQERWFSERSSPSSNSLLGNNSLR